MTVTSKYDFRPALLYGSQTESVIPWEALEKSRDSAPPYLAEQERVDLLLRAVNGDRLPVLTWTRMCGAPFKPVLPVVAPSSPEAEDLRRFWESQTSRRETGEVKSLPWDEQRVALVEQARTSLYSALEAVVKEPETDVLEMARNAVAISNDRVIQFGVHRERVIAQSIGAALIFALGLVLAPDRPYRRRLQQCALPAPECGRFALVAPPETRGQPPNYYCSDEHRAIHRKKQSKERVAASRAGMSVERYRRKLRGTLLERHSARQKALGRKHK